MTRSALVIHRDRKQLRFACEALVMFRPGYRVSTASDLDSASDWLEALTPDLVVLESSITDPDTLCRWAIEHGLERRRTVMYGRVAPEVDELGSATVPEPVKLPEFLATVRAVTYRETARGFGSTDPSGSGRH